MSRRGRYEKKYRKQRQRLRRLERHPPRLGHETMLELRPFRTATLALTERLQQSPGAPVRLFEEEDLSVAEVDAMLIERYSMVRQAYGWSDEDALMEVQQLCSHLAAAVNHAVAGKKTFWVAPELAEALVQTNLDIPGDVIRLPFACCAFVFNDHATLELAQSLIDQHTTRRAPYRTLTIYVYPARKTEEPGFDFVFLADAYDGEWPYMIVRSVPTDGKRNLDEILRSHPEGSTDELFFAPEMDQLLHLAINAVLYATSADMRSEERAPAPPGSRRQKHAQLSGEQVYYLPGRIRVGDAPQSARPSGRHPETAIHKRFWVRGHWRRPNPSWEDQRLRWIAPYLKGPELAAIIERQYDLVGSQAGPGALVKREPQ